MTYTKIATWLFLFIIFQSCQPATSVPNGIEQTPFFDLKSYFQQEKERLAGLPNFTKTTVVGDKTETKKLTTINWENELRIFQQSDINRPAWFDKYQVDSVLQNGNLAKITYTATDKALEVQNIIIDFNQAKVTKINIEKNAETALADTQFKLSYEPQKGYLIENTQQLTVGEDKLFLVKVQF